MDNLEKQKLTEFVSALPERKGDRPQTAGPAPHSQLNQYPSGDALAMELDAYILSFESVYNG